MRKVMKNNKRTKKILDKCQKIYLVVHWAKYGVMEHYFSGKFDKDGVTPLVWHYVDCNGTKNEWHLMPIYQTTIGACFCWCNFRNFAEHIANALNKQAGFDREGI